MKYDDCEFPTEGEACIVKGNNYTAVAFYCDGEFYTLKYDPYLGVLRKSHIDKPLRKNVR